MKWWGRVSLVVALTALALFGIELVHRQFWDGNDYINGGDGGDTIHGGIGNDTIVGGPTAAQDGSTGAPDGNDLLFGDDGDDSISGGAGTDTIVGGHGNDTIDAAGGAKTIEYTSVLDGHDVIKNFDATSGTHDVLDLTQLFDGIAAAPTTALGREALVHVQQSGPDVVVSVDADGNAGNGFELTIATIQSVSSGTFSVGNGATDDIHVGGV